MAPLGERVLQFLQAKAEEGQMSAGQLLREVQMVFDNLNSSHWQVVRGIVSQFSKGVEREGEHEDEGDAGLDTAVGETFCSYSPGLVGVGNPHPDEVDISATLASIAQPECTYIVALPEEVVCRRLSRLQLETVMMACQRFQGLLPDGSRQGFFLGDGAGMGKGRQIGGLLYELLYRGHRKAVWFSASSGLHYDAERDIGDLGALKFLKLHRLDQYGYGSLPMDSGVLFSTYTMLVSVSSDGTSRLDQIVDWLGEDFEGLIVFDEAHKAKNGEYVNRKGKLVKGTITAAAVFELQRRLPKARVLYVSATAVTEPHHLAYMPRLGLWGQGASLKDFPALLKMCSQGGVGAMEILCMEMKMRGMFLSRTLSYRHPETPAQFEIKMLNLTEAQVATYEQAVGFFQRMLAKMRQAVDDVKEAGFVTKSNCGPYYWGAHQRFFKMLCIACKTGRIVALARSLVEEGNQVVMSLQGTGEAYQERTDLARGGGEEDLMDKAPQQLLASAVTYLFPPVAKKDLERAREEKPELFKQREELLEEVRALGMPDNPLDDLKLGLGGPDKVAELTGRKQMVVLKDGRKTLKSRAEHLRCSSDEVNLYERDLFQKGHKLVCIISDAASSGISLQADRNCPVDPATGKVRRRHHITLELPWSADKCVQQLGRSHRSNQVSAPFYHLTVSDVAGEKRFASAVAKRLQSLGALTNGDRRSVISNMGDFDLDNQYGVSGLKAMLELLRGEVHTVDDKLDSPSPDMMRDLLTDEGLEDPTDDQLLERARALFQEMREDLGAVELLERKKNKKVAVPRFLNRILGVQPARQSRLFKFFCLHVDAEIARARKNGTFVEAIGQLGRDYKSVEVVEGPTVVYTHPENGAEIFYYRFKMDKGADWDKAIVHYKEEPGHFNGFWRCKNEFGRERYILLATELPPGSGVDRLAQGARGRLPPLSVKKKTRFRLMRPNNANPRGMNLAELQDKYDFVNHFDADEYKQKAVKEEWVRQYTHGAAGGGSFGRIDEAHFLAGSLTCIWPLVQDVVAKGRKKMTKVCRIKETTENGRQVIGLHIRDQDDVTEILQRLESNDLPTDYPPGTAAPEEAEDCTGWGDIMQTRLDKRDARSPGHQPRGGPRKEAKRKRKFERFQRPELPVEPEEVAQLEQSGLWEKLPPPPVVDPDAYEVPVSAEAEPPPVPIPRQRSNSARQRGVSNRGEAPRTVSGGRGATIAGASENTRAPVHTEGERSGGPGVNDGHGSGESVRNRGAEEDAPGSSSPEAGPSVIPRERAARAKDRASEEAESAGPSGTERGEWNARGGSGRRQAGADSDTDLDSEDEADLDAIMKIDWRMKTTPKSGVRNSAGEPAAGSGKAGDGGASAAKQERAAASKGRKKRAYVDLDPDTRALVKEVVVINLDSDDETNEEAELTGEARRPGGATTEDPVKGSHADVKWERASPRKASQEPRAFDGVKPDCRSSPRGPLTPRSPMQVPTERRAAPAAGGDAVSGRANLSAEAVGSPPVVGSSVEADGAASSLGARGCPPGVRHPFGGGSDTPSGSPKGHESEPGSVSAPEGEERPGEDKGTAEGSAGEVAGDERNGNTAEAWAGTGPGVEEDLGTPASLQRKRVEAEPTGRDCSPVSERKCQDAVKKKLFVDEETPVAAAQKKRKMDEITGDPLPGAASDGAGRSSEGKRARVELASVLTAAKAADNGTRSPGTDRPSGGISRPTPDSFPGTGSRYAAPVGEQPVRDGASLANSFKRNAIAKALRRVRNRGRSAEVPGESRGTGATPQAEVWPAFFEWPEKKKRRTGEAKGVEAVTSRKAMQEGTPLNGERPPGGLAVGVKPGLNESGLPRLTLDGDGDGQEVGKEGPGGEDVAENGTKETGPPVSASSQAENATQSKALQVVAQPADAQPAVAAAPANFLAMLAGMDRRAVQAMADFFQAFAKRAQ